MPGFSDSLLNLHFTLYKGYVKNTNDVLLKLQLLRNEGKASSFEYGAFKRRLGWEFDGMRLHELYFENLGGNGSPDQNSPLISALSSRFGSFENWKKDFIATATMRGIGWAILYLDPAENVLINTWVNEHDTGHLATGSPILIMDVFEHAYMPQYGLDRAGYIGAFFMNIDWETVETRYNQVIMGKKE